MGGGGGGGGGGRSLAGEAKGIHEGQITQGLGSKLGRVNVILLAAWSLGGEFLNRPVS